MESLQESAPLAFCVIDDRAVFLDIDGDRYFCLPSKLNQAFMDGLSQLNGLKDEARERLVQLGILTGPSAESSPSQPRICSPAQDLKPGNPRRFLLSVAVAQSRMRLRLRRWSFSQIICAERHREKARCNGSKPLEPHRLYGSFHALSPWFGEEDQCLVRALAFRMIAMKRGHDASLVIGVKLDPFAAHCWVQDGPRLLNDRLERVRLFTPILAL